MILLIDSYDSFSHNLRRLLEVNSGREVVTIFNDTFLASEYENAFDSWIRNFDYIVVGPGPGHPKDAKDVGIVGWLFRHFKRHPHECIPVLGVCLGFQSMCHEFGNEVARLGSVKHGQIYSIVPVETELFGGDLAPFPSVRYHSLHVSLQGLNEEILPLATCEDSEGKEKVLMAGKHRSLPLYGVQYHPESVCSSKGDLLVRNFDAIATKYNEESRPGLKAAQNNVEISKSNKKTTTRRSVHEDFLVPGGSFVCNGAPDLFVEQFTPKQSGVMPIDVCDYFAANRVDFTFLNSAADPGQWSIIGLPIVGESQVITHSIDDPKHVFELKFKLDTKNTTHSADSMWSFLALQMAKRYVSRGALESRMKEVKTRAFPFFGGYMGVMSYEEGKHLDSLKMSSPCEGPAPDTKLVFIERFILYDRSTKSWFLVSIRPQDEDFCRQLIGEITGVEHLRIDGNSVPKSVKHLCQEQHRNIRYDFPSRDVYKKQFELCQEYLHSGDSYELCLTTQLKLHLPNYLDPWDIYKVLAMHKNPSPYSSYMSFDDCTLISSSPERFLSWSDSSPGGRKVAELRPIKGTVKNTSNVTLEDATKILRTPKEMGENLMIVDLIRHDLQAFTEDVTVDALMAVEEYKTVYQLVSVIRGHLAETGYKGIDVLLLSLPPGSMTGAPKKRSIELLQDIESLQPTMMPGGRRGLYSGVAGYWSITDDADWSVTIRSIVNYSKDLENLPETNVWRIGAGGAITVLSEEEAEWEEMHVKLSSTLQTFV